MRAIIQNYLKREKMSIGKIIPPKKDTEYRSKTGEKLEPKVCEHMIVIGRKGIGALTKSVSVKGIPTTKCCDTLVHPKAGPGPQYHTVFSARIEVQDSFGNSNIVSQTVLTTLYASYVARSINPIIVHAERKWFLFKHKNYFYNLDQAAKKLPVKIFKETPKKIAKKGNNPIKKKDTGDIQDLSQILFVTVPIKQKDQAEPIKQKPKKSLPENNSHISTNTIQTQHITTTQEKINL